MMIPGGDNVPPTPSLPHKGGGRILDRSVLPHKGGGRFPVGGGRIPVLSALQIPLTGERR